MEWSVATEEEYKNGERLAIKHNKVKLSMDNPSLSVNPPRGSCF